MRAGVWLGVRLDEIAASKGASGAADAVWFSPATTLPTWFSGGSTVRKLDGSETAMVQALLTYLRQSGEAFGSQAPVHLSLVGEALAASAASRPRWRSRRCCILRPPSSGETSQRRGHAGLLAAGRIGR